MPLACRLILSLTPCVQLCPVVASWPLKWVHYYDFRWLLNAARDHSYFITDTEENTRRLSYICVHIAEQLLATTKTTINYNDIVKAHLDHNLGWIPTTPELSLANLHHNPRWLADRKVKIVIVDSVLLFRKISDRTMWCKPLLYGKNPIV